MIFIDDEDVCPICGAYWGTFKRACVNGHSNTEKFKY